MVTDTRAMHQARYALSFNARGEELRQTCARLNMMPGVDAKYDPYSIPSVIITSSDHAALQQLKAELEQAPGHMKVSNVRLREL